MLITGKSVYGADGEVSALEPCRPSNAAEHVGSILRFHAAVSGGVLVRGQARSRGEKPPFQETWAPPRAGKPMLGSAAGRLVR